MGLVEHDSSQLSTCNKLCSKRSLMLYSLLCVTIDFRINGLSMTCIGIKNVEATSRCQSLRLLYALYASKNLLFNLTESPFCPAT